MTTEPIIRRGPDWCPDCTPHYCEHERTIGIKSITWTDDDGVEWGKSVSFTHEQVEEANFDMMAYMDETLMACYEAWLRDNESKE